MANTLTISAPTVVGGSASFISINFKVTDGATTLSDTFYYFHANTLSTVYDNSAVNIAVLYFGPQHIVTMSNGDYATIIYDGTPQANVVTAAASVVAAIAPFTT